MKLHNIDKALLRAILTYLAFIAIFIAIGLLFGCTPSRKMVMPDVCKPAKKAKYEMVRPEPTIKRKK